MINFYEPHVVTRHISSVNIVSRDTFISSCGNNIWREYFGLEYMICGYNDRFRPRRVIVIANCLDFNFFVLRNDTCTNGIISAAKYGVLQRLLTRIIYSFRPYQMFVGQTHSNLAPADLSQIGVTSVKCFHQRWAFYCNFDTAAAQLCAAKLTVRSGPEKDVSGEHDLLHY